LADPINRVQRDRDMRQALVALDAIAAGGRDPRSFVRQALDQLAELVGSDLTTLSVCDLERQTRLVFGRPGETLSDDDRSAFDRHFREHPLVRYHSTHPAGPTQRITDCVSQQSFRDSPVFSDYYRRIGIGHVMALPLRIDAAMVVSMVFNRSGSGFSAADRARVDALRLPLAALYRSILASEEARLAQASLRRLAAGAGWYIAKVGGDGQLSEVSAAGIRALLHFFGDVPASGNGPAPTALRAWLHHRSANWGLDWLRPGAADPYMVERGGWRLTVHFIADPLAADRGELLMLRERVAVAASELAALPLTRREREVLAILTAGKTNDEIGTVLEISPRTVQKHLEHIFDKLGVETRMAAALRALAADDDGH
jgi:DNA-binding CsgD family transcriptional regulator